MKKVLKFIYAIFSLIVISYSVMFIISQMVNIKYYFDNSLPINGNNYSIPICEKEFFLELILYAKILIIYAICGIIVVISSFNKKSKK